MHPHYIPSIGVRAAAAASHTHYSSPQWDGSGTLSAECGQMASPVYCFLDIDIDGEKAAFKRCREFVKATNLTYGLSSNEVSKLGGSEKARLQELYDNDYDWGSSGQKILVNRVRDVRVIVELYPSKSPLAVENFVALCCGSKGMCKQAGKSIPLHYKGCRFHRIVSDFMCQTGDFVMGNGTGGESIFNGKKFKDDPAGLKLKHDGPGVLSMCNSGKNSNTSQFFLTLPSFAKKSLDGKHVVFGGAVRPVLHLQEGTV